MPSELSNRLFPNLTLEDISNIDRKPIDNIKEDIKKDKKTYKHLKDDSITVKPGGKKRGRPRKPEGMKKEKLNLHIEPKYKNLLQAEANERGIDLGPYIVSAYIVEPLKKKYGNL
jgi:hypothetical protein